MTWLECTDQYVLAGTGWSRKAITWSKNTENSWIAVLDKNSSEIVKKWCTEKPGFDYCYNERLEMIFSAHLEGEIIGWDLQGIIYFVQRRLYRNVLPQVTAPQSNKIAFTLFVSL